MATVTFDDDDNLDLDDERRKVLARGLKIVTLLRRLGDDGAAEAARGLTKLVEKYPVEKSAK